MYYILILDEAIFLSFCLALVIVKAIKKLSVILQLQHFNVTDLDTYGMRGKTDFIMMLSRLVRSGLGNSSRRYATKNTIDPDEIQKFKKLVVGWWEKSGPMLGLHTLNQLRVPFIRECLISNNAVKKSQIGTPNVLCGLEILDVGCGGGILSEPLARLGGIVTGIDANSDLINVAKAHANLNSLRNVTYVESSMEEHASQNHERYDAVVASEVIEHITEKEQFIQSCVKCLKPGGSIIFTTVSKTFLSNVLAIHVAENLLSLVPRGTHQYDKFIQPHELQRLLEKCKCRTDIVQGMCYNILNNTWHWISSSDVNYVLHATKIT